MRNMNWRSIPMVPATFILLLTPTSLALGNSPYFASQQGTCESGMERVTRLGRGLPNDVAWSPDGERVAIATTLGVDFIDANDLTYLDETIPSVTPLAGVAWSPDSMSIAAATQYGELQEWNVAEGEMIFNAERWSASPFGASVRLSWSPDGTMLAIANEDNLVRVFDALTGEQLLELAGHNDTVTSLDWSSKDNTLASGSLDGTVRLWDTNGESVRDYVVDGTDPVTDLAWSPGDARIAVATQSGDVLLVDPISHTQDELLGQNGIVNTLSWSPDGRSLAGATNSGHALVWNAGTGEVTFERRNDAVEELNQASIHWSPDGTRLVVGDSYTGVEVWNVATGQLLASFPILSYRYSVTSAAWSPDGEILAFGPPLRLWDRNSQQMGTPIQQPEGTFASLDWSSDGNLLSIVSDAGDVTVIDPVSHETVATFNRPQPSGGQVTAWDGAFRPGTHTLAISYDDNTVWLWDVDTGEVIPSVQIVPGTYGLGLLSWSPDGSLLAVANGDGAVGLWDYRSAETLKPVVNTGAQNTAVTWNPSEHMLAVGAGTILIWTDLGREPHSLQGHEAMINTLAWSPNGRWLVSGSLDGTARLWDVQSEMAGQVLFESSWSVNAADWSPDGSQIAVGGGGDNRWALGQRTGAVMEIWGCAP